MLAGLRSPPLLKNSMPFHSIVATKAGLVSLIFRMSLRTWRVCTSTETLFLFLVCQKPAVSLTAINRGYVQNCT